jgi:hypothetical protein
MSGPVFKLSDHSKTGQKSPSFYRLCPVLSGFLMVFNKMAAKAIQKPDTKSVRKMTILNPDSPVFGY